MLPHAIFYDTLGSIADESSDEWKATVAGLFVLRLVDDWLDFGLQIVATDISGLAAVRNAIAQVAPTTPVRTILGDILSELMSSETVSIRNIASPMLAYAQALQYAGHSALEEEVLATLNKYATADDDVQTAVITSIRLGIVVRGTGRLDLAEQYHLSAAERAYAVGDVANALHARLGYAKTTAVRGDVGRADAMCADIAVEAERNQLPYMHGRALHDRAHIAYLRSDYQSTIRLVHQAMEHIDTPRDRDRLLGDLAAAFSQIGHFAAARDTNLILASCAQEQVIRWQANINLMYVAIKENQEEMFDLYRAALGCIQLPPREEIYYRWIAGKGFRVFGDEHRAAEELREAHTLAEQYHMQQLVFQLEEELSKQPVGDWGPDIDSIATSIGEELVFYTHNVA